MTFFCDARWDLKTMFLTCQLSPRDFARGGSEQNVLDYTTRRKHTVSFLRRSMFIAHKFWMVSLQRSQIFIADNSMVNSCGISPTLIFNANYTEQELNQSHISLGAGLAQVQNRRVLNPQIQSCHCNIILYISKAIVIFPPFLEQWSSNLLTSDSKDQSPHRSSYAWQFQSLHQRQNKFI